MARFDTFVAVPHPILVLLDAAASEHNVSIGRFASLVCDAASRLWVRDPRTSAMPSTVGVVVGSSGHVPVALTGRALAGIADAAALHGIAIDVQIRGILIAAVQRYEPPAPPPGAPPKRRPFDPAYYARNAIIPDAPKGKPASAAQITAAFFGDPRRPA